MWADANVRRLLLSRLISWVGNAIAPVALAFALLGMGASATTLGLVEAGLTGGFAATTLFGGVLADRRSRRAVMVASDLGAGAAQALAAVLVLADVRQVAAIGVLETLGGLAGGLRYPASAAAIPSLVAAPTARQRVTALARLAVSVGMVSGGACAGVLVATGGAGMGLAIDAVSFAIAAALVGRISDPMRSAPADESEGSVLRDLRAGWRASLARPWFVIVLAQFAVVNMAELGAYEVLGPVTLYQRPQGAALWAVIVTADAVGMALGALVMLRLPIRRPLLTGGVAMLGTAAPMLLLGARAPLWTVVATSLVSGGLYSVFGGCWNLAMQEHVPGPLMSRLAAYDMLISVITLPVGSALAGPLAASIGLAWSLAGLSLISLLASTLALLSRSVRTLPRLAPTPDPTSALVE